MLSPPCRCFNRVRHINNGYFTATSNNISSLNYNRNYSKNKDDCCNNTPQTESKKVEPWPKEGPATVWRKACCIDPKNCDPYKIKATNVRLPPLPSPNVKEIPNEDTSKVLNDNTSDLGHTHHEMQGLFCNPAVVHPDNWKRVINCNKFLQEKEKKDLSLKLGYHGKNKYKYAFHEPWNPLDRLTLLEKAEKEEMHLSENDVGPSK